jgi:CHAT domain-containing protein
VTLLACLVLLAAWSDPAAAADAPGPSAFAKGVEAYERGAFEQAAAHWLESSRLAERGGDAGARIRALTHLAQAYQALGQYRAALADLETALALAQASGDRARMAWVGASLGSVQLALGSRAEARASLDAALGHAESGGHGGLAASVLNNLGNLLAAERRADEALAAYRRSAELAGRAGDRALRATALTNLAIALREAGQVRESRATLDDAVDATRSLPRSHDTAYALITLGLGYAELRPALPDAHAALILRAAQLFDDASAIAQATGDSRALSYAAGHLGALYEDEGRTAEALQLTRRAVLAAQQVQAPESLYRWQWQTGRILKTLGRVDDAIAAYRRAVQTLQAIRPELAASAGASHRSFREAAGRVYFELVDLLLQRAARTTDPAFVPPILKEARETVELLKVAELRDYFRDDCVDAAQAKLTSLDVVSKTAVVVYPVLLPDRTELLLSLPQGLSRFTVPVGLDELTREVREFRRALEKRTTREYLPHAQKLYDWLIRPLEPTLDAAKLDTLVFVPDGPLRTIPMAALHDGRQFLVSRYALGTTPSLNLTDPRPLRRDNTRVLAVGITESVQGFPPLPSVSEELAAVGRLFGGTTLLDREFVMESLESKLRTERYSIVHVASHGQIASEVDRSFLLTFDRKLTMDKLEEVIGRLRFRDDPLELLTLSACETAAGDDRAALGLAGIAVKAGARSALASLWHISDQATADLITDFYRELQESPSLSRAAALQRAQLKLARDPRYQHPGFWAAFLLINNWL